MKSRLKKDEPQENKGDMSLREMNNDEVTEPPETKSQLFNKWLNEDDQDDHVNEDRMRPSVEPEIRKEVEEDQQKCEEYFKKMQGLISEKERLN